MNLKRLRQEELTLAAEEAVAVIKALTQEQAVQAL
jgi:hypothetical protein